MTSWFGEARLLVGSHIGLGARGGFRDWKCHSKLLCVGYVSLLQGLIIIVLMGCVHVYVCVCVCVCVSVRV